MLLALHVHPLGLPPQRVPVIVQGRGKMPQMLREAAAAAAQRHGMLPPAPVDLLPAHQDRAPSPPPRQSAAVAAGPPASVPSRNGTDDSVQAPSGVHDGTFDVRLGWASFRLDIPDVFL